MTVDFEGTTPGLPPAQPNEKRSSMRCKRHPGCKSMTVRELDIPGASTGMHRYQCVLCGHSWGVAVGGAVNL